MGKFLWFLCLAVITGSFAAQAQDYKKVIKDGKTTYEATAKQPDKQQAGLQKRLKSTSTEDVVLYTKNGCKDCDRIGRVLTKHQVRYQKKRIDLSTTYIGELLELTGNSETPTLLIQGKIQRELSQEAIEQQLMRSGYKVKTVGNRPINRKPPAPKSGLTGITRSGS